MMERTEEPVSRRAVLSKSLRILGVVAGLAMVAAAESDAQQKMAPKLVQYQQTPKNNQKCSICLHFVAPDSCKLVEGKINPEGWCALFAPKPAK